MVLDRTLSLPAALDPRSMLSRKHRSVPAGHHANPGNFCTPLRKSGSTRSLLGQGSPQSVADFMAATFELTLF